MKPLPSEGRLIQSLRDALKQIGMSSGAFKVRECALRTRFEGWELDAIVSVDLGRRRRRLFVNVMRLAHPKSAREAAAYLASVAQRDAKAYGVLFAPYVSAEAGKICRELDVGYLDLSGNCHLRLEGILVSIAGRPNLYRQPKAARTLFARKASRVARVLLQAPDRVWHVKDLAKAAQVSIGLASRLKTRLLEEGYADEAERRIHLREPERLLKAWSARYAFDVNESQTHYTLDPPAEFEPRLADFCREHRLQYALTGLAGAARVAPYALHRSVAVYVPGALDRVTRGLGLRQVETGGNVILAEPWDESLLWDSRKVNGVWVAGDIQLYLDLMSFGPRADEAAEHLLEERIRNAWERNLSARA